MSGIELRNTAKNDELRIIGPEFVAFNANLRLHFREKLRIVSGFRPNDLEIRAWLRRRCRFALASLCSVRYDTVPLSSFPIHSSFVASQRPFEFHQPMVVGPLVRCVAGWLRPGSTGHSRPSRVWDSPAVRTAAVLADSSLQYPLSQLRHDDQLRPLCARSLAGVRALKSCRLRTRSTLSRSTPLASRQFFDPSLVADCRTSKDGTCSQCSRTRGQSSAMDGAIGVSRHILCLPSHNTLSHIRRMESARDRPIPRRSFCRGKSRHG